jgi:hypothetical protein
MRMVNRRVKILLLVTLYIASTSAIGALAQSPTSSAGSLKVTEGELDQRLDHARALAKQGQYAQSLKEYLFVFDNSRNVGGYGGVRLSYVPAEIAAIGRVYNPAIVALQNRRDEREKLVFAGNRDFDTIHELTSLNEYLGTPERNLGLFDKLKTMGTEYAEAREDMLTLVWKQLVEAKRYSDLRDKIDELAKRVASQVAESVINSDFPDNDVFSTPQYQSYLRHSIVNDGGGVYETLLGIGRKETAEKLAKWMLTFSSDGEMYAQLINSAINAGQRELAGELVERANKVLKTGEDLQPVRQAAERLSKQKAN